MKQFLKSTFILPPESITPTKVRKRALWGMLFSIVLSTPFVLWLAIVVAKDWNIYGYGWGVPLIPFLVFFAEFIFGIKIDNISEKWDNLKGWQRGILGLLIVAVAVVVIFSLCCIFLTFYLD